jgi:hypothetical protein
MDPYQQQPAVPQQKQGMGCFAKGCLTLFVLLSLLGVIVGIMVYTGYRKIAGYIADKPANIRVYPATDAQYNALTQKMTPFALAIQTNQASTLELSADEMNTLIARDPNFAHLRGKTYLTIENNELGADMSFPIDDDAKSGRAATKYFNGHVVLGVSVEDGRAELLPKRVEANGQPLPGWLTKIFANKDFMTSFNQSFNESFQKNPKVRDLMQHLRSVRIENNRFVLTSTSGPGGEPVNDTPAAP